MMERFRLWSAARLVFFAARVGPSSMRPIFGAYGQMLESFPEQFQKGRTYGVILTPWSIDETGHHNASLLTSAAVVALKECRRQIDA
jgi:hypothetical protein